MTSAAQDRAKQRTVPEMRQAIWISNVLPHEPLWHVARGSQKRGG